VLDWPLSDARDFIGANMRAITAIWNSVSVMYLLREHVLMGFRCSPLPWVA
jgi:hypothetical protein